MKPLVIIIEDDPELREDLLARFVLERLNADYLSAAALDSGLKLLAEHDPDSNRPANLLILDMHLPENSAAINIHESAGIDILFSLKSAYKLAACPTVVFTGYPSFDNCVAAINAGARAYVPKVRIELEGGMDHLERVCLKLIKEQNTKSPHGEIKVGGTIPSDEWFRVNYQWLWKEYFGKWVSFVSEEAAINVGDIKRNVHGIKDGLVVLSGPSFKDVRQKVLSSPFYYQYYPPIIFVGSSDDAGKLGGGL